MRYLHFKTADETKSYYELIRQGAVATNREINLKREGRVFDKLMTKLEEVGTKEGELITDTTVAFEDTEFELLSDCLQNVKWTTQGVRTAYKMMDWFNSAPNQPTLELDKSENATA